MRELPPLIPWLALLADGVEDFPEGYRIYAIGQTNIYDDTLNSSRHYRFSVYHGGAGGQYVTSTSYFDTETDLQDWVVAYLERTNG